MLFFLLLKKIDEVHSDIFSVQYGNSITTSVFCESAKIKEMVNANFDEFCNSAFDTKLFLMKTKNAKYKPQKQLVHPPWNKRREYVKISNGILSEFVLCQIIDDEKVNKIVKKKIKEQIPDILAYYKKIDNDIVNTYLTDTNKDR